MATTITAFDLTPKDCKVVQLVGPKVLTVRRALLIPFHDLPEETEAAVAAKAQAIREALRLHKIQPINPVLVIPKHSATVRSVFLPSNDPGELAGMARFEAEKIIPFNVERHVITHAVLSQESIGGSRVLLAAVDEPVVSESLHVLIQAGVEPVAGQVSSLSLLDAWRRETPQPPDGVTALVNIGSVHTDITLISKNVLLTTRSVLMGTDHLLEGLTRALKLPRPLEALDLVSLDALEPEHFHPPAIPPVSQTIAGGGVAVGGKIPPASTPPPSSNPGSASTATRQTALSESPGESLSPRIVSGAPQSPFEIVREKSEQDEGGGSVSEVARQWIGRLMTEIRRTFDFARREFEIGSLEHIRLSGEGALIQGLDQSLTVTLGANVATFKPLAAFPKAPKQPEIDERLAPIFSIAAGGALRGLWSGAYPINLLPSEMLARQERQLLRLALTLLGAMVLIAATISYLYFSTTSNYRAEKLRLYGQFNSKMETEVRDLKDKKRKIGILEEYQRDRASSLAILDVISAYPKIGPTTKNGRITISSFNYASGDEVKIDGDALDIPDINDFVAYLEKFEIEGKRVFRRVLIRQHPPVQLSGRANVYSYQLVCFLNQ